MAVEKHEVLLRLKAIELLAYWEGRLVTNRLMAWFGISRQQASSDIKRYIKTHNPESLVHDPSVKAYVPRAGFQPVITKGYINEYLAMVSGLSETTAESAGAAAITLESEDGLAAVQLPDRTVRPEIVREIHRACRLQSSVRILYCSMANPVWAERDISPHTLIYTGFRWHVRAYCHKRGEFRDFILSRIDRTPKRTDIVAPAASTDTSWNEHIQLTLIPNPKLNSGQQSLVEKDYGMPDGRLELTVRKALAHYTLQRYQAAITADEAANEYKFPIILQEIDRKKLSPYLFDQRYSTGHPTGLQTDHPKSHLMSHQEGSDI